MLAGIAFAQHSGVIKDKITQESIPYVNIQYDGEIFGVSADEKGQFTIPKAAMNKVLVFSAVGYRTIRLGAKDLQGTVLMEVEAITLADAVISAKKLASTVISVNKFKKKDVNVFYICDGYPWINALYFPYHESYKNTPFVKSISLVTKSFLDQSKFSIRLYLPDENGKPGRYLHDKAIIAVSQKGKKVVKIDLSDQLIAIPKDGMLIALEWLIIEENRRETKTQILGEDKWIDALSYEPMFGSRTMKSNENAWQLIGGDWTRPKNWGTEAGNQQKTRSEYQVPAISIELSN